jgi:4-amino-4-deoxy-L-arabinose transferase-like glycosyltransferase
MARQSNDAGYGSSSDPSGQTVATPSGEHPLTASRFPTVDAPRAWRSWAAADLGGWIDRHPLALLLVILLVALTLGVVKLWRNLPTAQVNPTNLWWQIELNVSHGRGYVGCAPDYFPFCGSTNQVTATREPVPVLLFATVAFLTNESLGAVAAIELAINLAILLAVFCLTREMADTRSALIAALLWAVYLPPIQLFYFQVSGDLLATLGVALSMWFFLRACRTDQRRDWLIAGVWLGLGALSRSAIAMLGPVLIIGVLRWTPHDARRPWIGASTVRRVVPFAIAMALTMAPWLARNYLAFGRPVLGSTLGDYNFYRANSQLLTNQYLHFVGSRDAQQAIQAVVARQPDLNGTENEAQMAAVYRAEALQLIRAAPQRYAMLSAARLVMLWFNWTVNAADGRPNGASDYLMILQHGLLLGTAVAGLRRMWSRAWPLVLSVGALSLLYMAVIARLHYIVPVMPLIVALSATTCTSVVRHIGRLVRPAGNEPE